MALLYWFESIRTPVLDTLMQLITRLGEETFFLAAALYVLWCVDKRRGYYLLSVGFMGTLINQWLKIACRIPRQADLPQWEIHSPNPHIWQSHRHHSFCQTPTAMFLSGTVCMPNKKHSRHLSWRLHQNIVLRTAA